MSCGRIIKCIVINIIERSMKQIEAAFAHTHTNSYIGLTCKLDGPVHWIDL